MLHWTFLFRFQINKKKAQGAFTGTLKTSAWQKSSIKNKHSLREFDLNTSLKWAYHSVYQIKQSTLEHWVSHKIDNSTKEVMFQRSMWSTVCAMKNHNTIWSVMSAWTLLTCNIRLLFCFDLCGQYGQWNCACFPHSNLKCLQRDLLWL